MHIALKPQEEATGLNGGSLPDSVGLLLRTDITAPCCAIVFVSLRTYLPQEEATGMDGEPLPDSVGLLLPLSQPVVFLHGTLDPRVGEGALAEVAGRMAAPDVRSVVLPVSPGVRGLRRNARACRS